jgi:hypothetical protein
VATAALLTKSQVLTMMMAYPKTRDGECLPNRCNRLVNEVNPRAEVCMKLMSVFGGIVVATVLSGSSGQVTAAQGQEKVTIIGCAVKGDGDGDGFLLANNVEQTTRTTVTQTPAGSTTSSTTTKEMRPARVLYWLDDDDHEVAKLMGQLIEVTGEIEGDVKRGEIEIERENGMIELEIKAGGRKANVKLADVPSAIGTSRSVKDREVELPYLVRKLDVKSAKSLAPSCR